MTTDYNDLWDNREKVKYPFVMYLALIGGKEYFTSKAEAEHAFYRFAEEIADGHDVIIEICEAHEVPE